MSELGLAIMVSSIQIYPITNTPEHHINDKCIRWLTVISCCDLSVLSWWAYGVVVLACLIFTAAVGVRIPVVAVKFHNVYDYTIERHPWQVSENHKPWVHPSHVREIG